MLRELIYPLQTRRKRSKAKERNVKLGEITRGSTGHVKAGALCEKERRSSTYVVVGGLWFPHGRKTEDVKKRQTPKKEKRQQR